MTFDLMAQAIVSGLLFGAIYALVAAGLTLILGVMRIFNLAHGEFLMLGMYATFFLYSQVGIDPYLALPFVTATLFALGCAVFLLLIRPVLNQSANTQVLLTIGVSIFLQNAALYFFSADTRSVHVPYAQVYFRVGPVAVSLTEVVAFAGAVIVSVVLYWLLRSTEFGRCVRAAAQNRDAAMLAGINVRVIYVVAFGIGTALLGVTGALLLPIYYVSPNIGTLFLMLAFVVVVLGGMGNFVGALIGGLIIGVTQAVATSFMPGSLASVVTFGLLVLLLLFKPDGIFGHGGRL
jgi:branched-chain amino acid transport system permease protein